MKKIFLPLFLFAVSGNVLISGCTTAHSRWQDKRIEELERRVSRIEFDGNDSPPTDDEFAKYRQQAKSTQ